MNIGKNDYTLTVTLSGNRPPVRIKTDQWPVVGYAKDGDDRWIVIRRRPEDGTILVSAVNRAAGRRGGYILGPGIDPETAIFSAACDADLPDQLAEHALGSMRAIPLDPPDPRLVVRLHREEWDTVVDLVRDGSDRLADRIQEQLQ